jgi:hypothetical protein
VLAGRWMRPAMLNEPPAAPRRDHPTARRRFERTPARATAGVAALALLAVLAIAPQAGGESGGASGPAVPDDQIMVPARMELTPAKPRLGEPVTVRVSGFGEARKVTPQVPSGEKVERTGRPAPFLDEQRKTQVVAYYGGTWLREPLRRVGDGVFEARFSFPGEGNWRLGPFFHLRETRWTERVRIQVSDEFAPGEGPRSHVYDLELAAEADPVSAPTWLKPIGFVLLAGILALAVWLVVAQLRILRDGGIGPLAAEGSR